jgi:tol-pal system protein YbgF
MHLSRVALILIIMLLPGCVSSDIAVKRQVEADARLEHLFQTVGSIEMRLNEVSSKLAAIEAAQTQQAADIKQLQGSVQELGTTTQILQAEMYTVVQTSSPKVELVNPEPSAKAKDGVPAAYVKAFGQYSANNFSAAIVAFEKFIKENPQSEYVPNAYYWIGECYYTGSDLVKALPAFQKVVDGWAKHPKAADAMLKIGISHFALKNHEKAKQTFEHLVRNYPGSPAASKARERLLIYDNPVSSPAKNAR